MASPTWLTVKEAADRAGVSEQAIRKQLASGRLNGRQMGWQWLVDPVSLRQYIEDRQERRRKTK